MFNKAYLVAIAVFLLVMSVLTYISCSWLGSITDPVDVVENYKYYSNLSWYFLLISSAILLVLANVILWNTRKSWAFWTSLLYFFIFIVLKTFWLDKSFYEYKNQEGFSLSPLLGVILFIIVAIFVFFNQLLVLRMHDKMYPNESAIEPLPEDLAENAEEKETSE